jgi:hypothetical protein
MQIYRKVCENKLLNASSGIYDQIAITSMNDEISSRLVLDTFWDAECLDVPIVRA